MKYEVKDCAVCEGSKALLCKDGGLYVRIHEGDLLIDHDDNELVAHDDIKLNFCSVCGRKLETK